MKAAMGAIFFGLILMFVTASDRTGADSKAQSRVGEKGAIEQRDQKQKSDTAQTEWFADPERGWIRAEEHAQKERERPRNKNSENKAGVLWDY
jgi:hypothetical protein